MDEVVLNNVGKCRCCLATMDINMLRSIYKCGKICGQITKLADMLKYTTDLEIFENDELIGHICNKCVVHVSKAYAFKRQCVKSDEELRKDLMNVVRIPSEHQQVVFMKTVESSETLDGGQEYTYQLVEEYEDEEHIDEVDEKSFQKDESVQILLNIDHTDEQLANIIPINEMTSPMNVVSKQEIIQEEVFEYEIENENNDDMSDDGATRGSDEDFEVIPKMVFRKYNKRNKKMPAPPYTCNVCQKVLSNYSSFKYHMPLHSDKKPFLCTDCGESFKTRNSYDGHIKTHNEQSMHKCETCGKSYRQAASLRFHMLSHSGEKPFVCKYCGKGMTQKSGYKKHLLVHTGEKPHRCDICSKDFRYSSNLIIHRRAHIGERKHQCEKCEKKFVGIEQLKRHILIHSEQPFSCDICKKCFNRKSSLQVHQNTHFKYKRQKSSIPTDATKNTQQELIFGS